MEGQGWSEIHARARGKDRAKTVRARASPRTPKGNVSMLAVYLSLISDINHINSKPNFVLLIASFHFRYNYVHFFIQIFFVTVVFPS